ncbi:MAG: Crp/Fnr family transcriptional regulator [Chloroflexota bacterium]
MDRETIAQALKRVPFLTTLNGRDLNYIAGLASVRSYRAGAIIVQQDDTAIALYCILSGQVRVERQQADGAKSILLAEMGPGGFFGEMSLVDDFPRSASVTAQDDTVCALLSKWDFQKELRSHPEMSLALLRVLSQRIRALDEKLAI